MICSRYKSFFFVAFVTTLMSVSKTSQTQNLVANGGFETGAYAPEWTLTTTGSGTFEVNPFPLYDHSGNYHALFNYMVSTQQPGTSNISQMLNTVAGEQYTLDFWAIDNNFDKQNGYDPLTVFWGGNVLDTIAVPNDYPNSPGYQEYQYLVQAVSSSTELKFSASTNGGNGPYMNLDDVSVIAVPEPGSVALLLSGMMVAGFAFHRRNRKPLFSGE